MSRRKAVVEEEVSGVRKSISDDEHTQKISNAELLVELSYLRERVEGLERRERVFLLSGTNPIVGGCRLQRCRCGQFATRAFHITQRMSGDHHTQVCDRCEVDHPIARTLGAKVDPCEYATPEAVRFARELNAQLDSVHKEIAT